MVVTRCFPLDYITHTISSLPCVRLAWTIASLHHLSTYLGSRYLHRCLSRLHNLSLLLPKSVSVLPGKESTLHAGSELCQPLSRLFYTVSQNLPQPTSCKTDRMLCKVGSEVVHDISTQ